MSVIQGGSGYGIFAQRFDSAGAPNGSEFQVNSYTTYRQRTPSISEDASGSFVVAWDSRNQDGSDRGVFAQLFCNDADGVCDSADNCPAVYNPGHEDADRQSGSLPLDAYA